jgi:putative transposase
MKYRPEFPGRFGCKEDAHVFCTGFFIWHNTVHQHSGIADHTPESVHNGLAVGILEQRAVVLEAAYVAHPERFIRAKPQPPALPTGVRINAPTKEMTQVQ